MDMTSASGAPVAAVGSALTSFADSLASAQHFVYFGANQHAYQVIWTPLNGGSSASITFEDRTAAAGAPAAATGSALSSFIDANGGQHAVYLGTNQHIYDADWIPGTGFGTTDVTAVAGSPSASAGSSLTTFVDPSGSPVAGGQHFVYEGSNQHIYQVFFNACCGWGYSDTNAATGSPVAATSSAITSFVDANYGQHFVYEGTNQQVYETYWLPSSGFGSLIVPINGTPAVGSALASFVDPSTSPVAGSQHIVYEQTNQNIE
jgi:hypothetical protein